MTMNRWWSAAPIAAALLAVAAGAYPEWLSVSASAQTRREAAGNPRTPWGDPDLQGEWTAEGEYGVPFERPAQFGTRPVLTDAEYAKRIEDVRIRDARDLERVDVLSGKVEGPNAPIPHWREYNTTSRRTSIVVDPPDGRIPARVPQARPVPVQRCGSLQRGEPCDTYEPLGRADIGRRNNQSEGEHTRVIARTAADRTVHADRQRCDCLSGHVRRPGDVDGIVDRRAGTEGAAG